MEAINCTPLKRRRSQSHSATESMNIDYGNDSSHLSITSKNPSFEEACSFSTSLPNESCLSESPWMKNKSKKETHNRVERKRRDFINAQIEKLSKLLPQEYFINNDSKMNKGLILKNSVEYISSLKVVDSFNQHLVRETEYAAKVIKLLLKLSDVNCPQLSPVEDNVVDLQSIFNDWFQMHQESDKMVQRITKSLSMCKNSMDDHDRITHTRPEVTQNPSTNTTSSAMIPILSLQTSNSNNSNNNNNCDSLFGRKRYSSLPSGFDTNSNIQVAATINPQYSHHQVSVAPILDTLLKQDCHNQNNCSTTTTNIMETTLKQLYNNNSAISSTNSITNDALLNTDGATGLVTVIPTGAAVASHCVEDLNSMINGARKEKTYFVLPKLNKTSNNNLQSSNQNSAAIPSISLHHTDQYTTDSTTPIDTVTPTNSDSSHSSSKFFVPTNTQNPHFSTTTTTINNASTAINNSNINLIGHFLSTNTNTNPTDSVFLIGGNTTTHNMVPTNPIYTKTSELFSNHSSNQQPFHRNNFIMNQNQHTHNTQELNQIAFELLLDKQNAATQNNALLHNASAMSSSSSSSSSITNSNNATVKMEDDNNSTTLN